MSTGKTKIGAVVLESKDDPNSIVASWPTGTTVNIIGTAGNWYYINFNGRSKSTPESFNVKETCFCGTTPSASTFKGFFLKSGDKLVSVKKVDGGWIYGQLSTDSSKKGYVQETHGTIIYKMLQSAYILKSAVEIDASDEIKLTTKVVKTTSSQYISAYDRLTYDDKATVGQSYQVGELVNGRYRVYINGSSTNRWIPAVAFTESAATPVATVPTASAKPVASNTNTSSQAKANAEPQTVAQNVQQYGFEEWTDTDPNYNLSAAYTYLEGMSQIDQAEYDDEYYRTLSFKWFNALGYPPKYNMDIDLQYPGANDDSGGSDAKEALIAGRVFTKTFMANPPILTICPGKVKMFPNLIGSKKDSEIEKLIAAATGMGSLKDKIEGDESSLFSGKLYKFEADTQTYSYYLNALCRACAILLKIGDEVAPWTGKKLKDFDYAYWALKRDINAAIQGDDGDKSMFKNFTTLFKEPSKIYTSLVEDTAYMNFFLNGAETSISETITTDVEDSPLAGMFNTVNSLSNTINYFTSSGFAYGSDEDSLSDIIRQELGTGNTSIDGILDLGKNFMNGGKVVLPKMVSGAHYGKSISCNTKFISPYGDPYSVFVKCIVPVCHLLALALPKQLSDNMYTYPFLIRAFQVGQFSCDLGVITNLVVNRGGPDETSWTVDGLATEWDVSFEITPLVDELMMSGTNHPGLFLKNENLIDYLGNYCGFDLYANNASTKSEMAMSFIKGFFTGIPRTIENYASDKLFNKLSGISQVAWGR